MLATGKAADTDRRNHSSVHELEQLPSRYRKTATDRNPLDRAELATSVTASDKS